MNTLILCGFKACGKTTLGRELALRWKCDFIDTDEIIIQHYCNKTEVTISIPELYAAIGEEQFRKQEREIIQQLNPRQRAVIATGGGSLLDNANRLHLRSLGQIVYLSLDPMVIKQRIQQSRVPVFMQSNFSADFDRLFNERALIYQQTAHCAVEITSLSSDDIVNRLAELGEVHGE